MKGDGAGSNTWRTIKFRIAKLYPQVNILTPAHDYNNTCNKKPSTVCTFTKTKACQVMKAAKLITIA